MRGQTEQETQENLVPEPKSLRSLGLGHPVKFPLVLFGYGPPVDDTRGMDLTLYTRWEGDLWCIERTYPSHYWAAAHDLDPTPWAVFTVPGSARECILVPRDTPYSALPGMA